MKHRPIDAEKDHHRVSRLARGLVYHASATCPGTARVAKQARKSDEVRLCRLFFRSKCMVSGRLAADADDPSTVR